MLGEGNKDLHQRRKFDPVSKVVDILLNDEKTVKASYQELLEVQQNLDGAIRTLSENRH